MAIERIDYLGPVGFARTAKIGKDYSVNNVYDDFGKGLVHKHTTITPLADNSVKVEETERYLVRSLANGKEIIQSLGNGQATEKILTEDEINIETSACLGKLIGWTQLYKYKPSSETITSLERQQGYFEGNDTYATDYNTLLAIKTPEALQKLGRFVQAHFRLR